jgi:hypothetical protein
MSGSIAIVQGERRGTPSQSSGTGFLYFLEDGRPTLSQRKTTWAGSSPAAMADGHEQSHWELHSQNARCRSQTYHLHIYLDNLGNLANTTHVKAVVTRMHSYLVFGFASASFRKFSFTYI